MGCICRVNKLNGVNFCEFCLCYRDCPCRLIWPTRLVGIFEQLYLAPLTLDCVEKFAPRSQLVFATRRGFIDDVVLARQRQWRGVITSLS
ncbi:hypothetical protein J6590_026140 [Homalodisca vitripennis]|nr:hypothetical protein J6590_026140 [Homalodisca vitripennis]